MADPVRTEAPVKAPSSLIKDLPQQETTLPQPENEQLTPREKFLKRIKDETEKAVVTDNPEDMEVMANNILSAGDEYAEEFAKEKVDEALESKSKENEELKNEIEKRKMYSQWDVDENEEDEKYRKYLEEYRRDKKNKSSKK